MQLPAFQRYRPCQDNRPQLGVKNGRILPLDTCDFAPKCHHSPPSAENQKFQETGLFNTLYFISFNRRKELKPLRENFGMGPPPSLSTGPVLVYPIVPLVDPRKSRPTPNVRFSKGLSSPKAYPSRHRSQKAWHKCRKLHFAATLKNTTLDSYVQRLLLKHLS